METYILTFSFSFLLFSLEPYPIWHQHLYLGYVFLPQVSLFGNCLLGNHRGGAPSWSQIQSPWRLPSQHVLKCIRLFAYSPFNTLHENCFTHLFTKTELVFWTQKIVSYLPFFLGTSYSQKDTYVFFFSDNCILYIYVPLDNS